MSGQKDLSIDSWLEPDPVNRYFARMTADGTVELDGDDWAEEFLSVNLSDRVPLSVREQFEVARGAMLYGWFYYPLFRLGEEQLFRVGEAAARARYRIAGGVKERPRFGEVVQLLIQKELIRAEDRERWDAIRQLRNLSSHAEHQSVMPPGAARTSLGLVAASVDELFSR